MSPERAILHVDMDAFFAAIEQLDNPALRGKPVLVGHDGPRGVVAAASYEAREWGCRSAQPMAVAKRNCPKAIIVPVRGSRYREVSAQLFDLLHEYTPAVEPLSVDEAFLDLTGTERLHGPPEVAARAIKHEIKQRLRLTASIGVAPNKFLAKLASDLEKPDGLTIIRAADIDRVLPPLPVTRLWGVGPAAAAALDAIGVKTIGDLRRAEVSRLTQRFGRESAEHMLALAHGRDARPVVNDREAKSIGHEQTFGSDLEDPDAVRAVLLEQVEQVARRLRRHGLFARTVSLKIRFGDFETISRAHTLEFPTDTTAELWRAASAVFDRWAGRDFHPVRLIGVSASQLAATPGQLDLFDQPQRDKQRQLDAAADRIAARFGKDALRRAGSGKQSKLGSSLRRTDEPSD
jgi:DNA polymerase-4